MSWETLEQEILKQSLEYTPNLDWIKALKVEVVYEESTPKSLGEFKPVPNTDEGFSFMKDAIAEFVKNNPEHMANAEKAWTELVRKHLDEEEEV